MAPLAGKPPFATDEPDTFYESSPSPQRRVRQPAPADPNKRTSAYDVYDNYLSAPDASNAANRQSGIGALGMGLLNMADDSDDDSDDEDTRPRQPAAPASKHAALAAATTTTARRSPSPASSPPHSPQLIAAPRPGYAAPISALNLARPEPAATRAPPPAPLQLPTPVPAQNPFDASSSPHARNPFTPSPSSTPSPHPLHPPITPITPVFARPAKAGVTFSESAPIPRKPIMRGNTEETLLPGRGEKGDDFWRRFSMVAKEESKKPPTQKESTWLRKTRSGSTRLSRWVYIIGFLLLACIGLAVGLGFYLTRNSPSHQQPTALGGSANEAATGVSSASTATKTGTKIASSSMSKVTPTHTVARREEAVVPTASAKRSHRNRGLLEQRTF